MNMLKQPNHSEIDQHMNHKSIVKCNHHIYVHNLINKQIGNKVL
jgi:hypothetical protein